MTAADVGIQRYIKTGSFTGLSGQSVDKRGQLREGIVLAGGIEQAASSGDMPELGEGVVDGTETEYLSQMKGMPAAQVRQMFDHVTQQAAGVGLNYDFDSIVVANSFTAHRFLHFAKTHGLMSEAKEALLSGHFEKGRDIGDIEYLAEVGQEIGLDPDEVRRVLATDEFTDEVQSDISEARSLGANGVPFFVIDRKYGISGAQPAEVFTQALETAWDEGQKLTVLAGTPQSAGSDSTEEFADGAVCGPDGCN